MAIKQPSRLPADAVRSEKGDGSQIRSQTHIDGQKFVAKMALATKIAQETRPNYTEWAHQTYE